MFWLFLAAAAIRTAFIKLNFGKAYLQPCFCLWSERPVFSSKRPSTAGSPRSAMWREHSFTSVSYSVAESNGEFRAVNSERRLSQSATFHPFAFVLHSRRLHSITAVTSAEPVVAEIRKRILALAKWT